MSASVPLLKKTKQLSTFKELTHLPSTEWTMLNGKTQADTVRSAMASETMKQFGVIFRGVQVKTLMITKKFPIIVTINMFMSCFHVFRIYKSPIFFTNFFLFSVKTRQNFSIEIKNVAKLFFKKKTLCSSFKRKQDIFVKFFCGLVDSEFVKTCHEPHL